MTKAYTCTLTANGWQLYSDMKGVEAVAADLSGSLTVLVREAKERLKNEPLLSEDKLAVEIRNKMHKHLDGASKFGASDTEPQCVLVAEIERALGLEQYSLERW